VKSKIPLIGLGTYGLQKEACTKAVLMAYEIGYRHIDTAHVYDNHAAIRKALKSLDRSQIFLTSKISLDQIDQDNVEKSVEKACDLALKELGVDQLDLYLIHWPDRKFPLTAIFKAMEKLVEKKKIHRAGVSNFTIHHLQDLFDDGCRPWANQVEFHPYLFQKELLDYCRLQKIELVAYRPLGKGALLEEKLFQSIGQKHGKTPCQVILRSLVQQNIPVIPKASTKEHLEENFAIFDFELSDSEMNQIKKLHRNKRFCPATLWGDFNY
jgi:diketogulonate reductase-like aldo/keto reductase